MSEIHGMKENLYKIRHGLAHVLAQAVQELHPEVQLGIGPPISNGFYYDFLFKNPITLEDLKPIEKKMKNILRQQQEFKKIELDGEKAIAFLQERGEIYKVELCKEFLAAGESITFYENGPFIDMCEGPHVEKVLDIPEKAFCLDLLAGAYWRGDEKNVMMTRIYGLAFETKEELDLYIKQRKLAQERDHRKLSNELDLFSTHNEVGAGLVFWHPNLGVVRKGLEEFWWQLHTKDGYFPVYTPHILREDVFKKSGHLENYSDLMYNAMDIDEIPFRAKPMNCPGHVTVYKTRNRSYRDLPLRWAELGTVYRYERSGQLHGMLRVRGFTQDDAHIFCTPDQLADEIAGVCRLVDTILSTFGFEYTAYLATRPAEKSIGEDSIWEKATEALKQAAAKINLPLELDEGGGAFYGPKIDFKIKDALGREWQNSTIQCDFNLPERFDMTYTAPDGTFQRPIMVHRAIYGSLERFVGGLIEHYGGAFPTWLAPEQVRIIPVASEFDEYAFQIQKKLSQEVIRAQVDDSNDSFGKKIRNGTIQKVPNLLIVGGNERDTDSVTLRRYGMTEQVTQKTDVFMQWVLNEIKHRLNSQPANPLQR